MPDFTPSDTKVRVTQLLPGARFREFLAAAE
jgi:hypothetical protein